MDNVWHSLSSLTVYFFILKVAYKHLTRQLAFWQFHNSLIFTMGSNKLFDQMCQKKKRSGNDVTLGFDIKHQLNGAKYFIFTRKQLLAAVCCVT